MTDRREYIKLDIGYLSNPKIASLLLARRPNAVLLHIACMTYARQHRTDGVVPTELALRAVIGATKRDFFAAVSAGLLIPRDDTTVEVHDYLEHQESAEQIAARSAAAVTANRARWSRSDRPVGVRSGSGSDSDSESRGEERRGDKTPSESYASPDAPTGAPAKAPKKRRATLPASWVPTDEHRQRATTDGVDIEREVIKFRTHAEETGRTSLSWNAAFTRWLINAAEYATRDGRRTAPAPTGVSPWDRHAPLRREA
jgi:hypothetical protein